MHVQYAPHFSDDPLLLHYSVQLPTYCERPYPSSKAIFIALEARKTDILLNGIR